MPKLPNTVMLSLIAAAQLVVNQQAPDFWWSPVALAALLALAKLFQVQAEPEPSTSLRQAQAPVGELVEPQPYGAAAEDDQPTRKLTRWLVD